MFAFVKYFDSLWALNHGKVANVHNFCLTDAIIGANGVVIPGFELNGGIVIYRRDLEISVVPFGGFTPVIQNFRFVSMSKVFEFNIWILVFVPIEVYKEFS